MLIGMLHSSAIYHPIIYVVYEQCVRCILICISYVHIFTCFCVFIFIVLPVLSRSVLACEIYGILVAHVYTYIVCSICVNARYIKCLNICVSGDICKYLNINRRERWHEYCACSLHGVKSALTQSRVIGMSKYSGKDRMKYCIAQDGKHDGNRRN